MYKKIVVVILTMLLAVWFMIKTAVHAAASFAAPVAIGGLAALIAAVLVATGTITSEQAASMNGADLLAASSDAVTAINDFCYKDHTPEEIKAAELFLATLTKEQLEQLMNSDNQLFNETIGKIIGEWIKAHTGNVEDVPAENAFDMGGSGAVYMRYFDNAKEICQYRYDISTFGNVEYVSGDYVFNAQCATTVKQYNSDGVMVDTWTTGGFTITFYPDIDCIYGDWRKVDGEVSELVTPIDTEKADVGWVIIDGVPYPVDADGNVIIDGVSYPISSDGTVIIGGDTYTPIYQLPYDNSSIIALLIALLNGLPRDVPIAADTPITSNPAIPAEIAASDFADIVAPPSIITVFPFCLPFDFINGIKLLSQPAEAPRFEVPFNVPEFGSFPGYSTNIVIDFAEYSKYFDVVRWVNLMLIIFGIIFLSFKIVKGIN